MAMDILDKYTTEEGKEKKSSNTYGRRPQTAVYKPQPKVDYERKPTFLMSVTEKNLVDKKYDYKNKSFKTVIKKSDPVARMNELKKYLLN